MRITLQDIALAALAMALWAAVVFGTIGLWAIGALYMLGVLP